MSADKLEQFEHVRMSNSIVNKIIRSGGTVEDCVVALAEVNQHLMGRILELEAIVPRRIETTTGRALIWRCPDHLVP